MRIAHIGLTCYFTEGMTYQDNYLSHQNAVDGHEVLYISNAAKYVDGIITATGYENNILADGVRLVRLPYKKILHSFLSEKIRKVDGLYQLLDDFKPNVILSHGLAYWSVLDVIHYKKDHPEVKLYVDTHTAADNSGRNWFSLHILHDIFYRYLTQKVLPYADKYWYIGESEREFSFKHYKVPEDRMEFYPLGGVLPSEENRAAWRDAHRQELNVAADELLLIHAGKLEPKKKTAMLLRAFSRVPELKAKLAVIGSIPEDVRETLSPLIEKDPRVTYLGWMSGEKMQEYLCACDLYVQPGKVSAIMQNALCCGVPVLSYPHDAYTKRYDYGCFIWCESEEELVSALQRLARSEYDLSAMCQGANTCARELLDYRALAARLYK